MSMNLQYVFDAITPENIRNIPVVKDAMEIFIKILEEQSQISKDISQIYNSDNENIKDAMIQTYIKTLYLIFNNAQNNEVLKAKLFTVNNLDGIPFQDKITTLVNDEYVTVAKSWSQKLGTELAIKFTYGFAKYLQSGEYTTDFKLTEIKPFHFKVGGSAYKEMYEAIVKPLSHPVGFCYDYNQIVSNKINDYFNVNVVYNFTNIEVRCISGFKFSVFTADTVDDNVKADFLTRKNPITNNLFTEEEFYNQVTVYTGKTPVNFTNTTINDNLYIGILFADDTYLQQYVNPIAVSYLQYQDYLKNNNKSIITFTDQCSLYLNYSTSYEITTSDALSSKLKKIFDADIYNTINDTLLMYPVSQSGYYLYTNDLLDQNNVPITGYYVYTTDDFYLHTS